MAKNAGNLNIGDCDVYFGGSVVGYLKGAIKWTVDRKFTDLTADEFGTTPLDMALTGQDMMIQFTMAEITTANLSIATPENRYDPGSGGDSKMGIGKSSGFLLSTVAKELQLHPRRYGAINIGAQTGNMENDIFIWKAVPSEKLELDFDFNLSNPSLNLTLLK